MSATTAGALNLTSPSSTLSATNVFYFLLVPAVLIWYIYWKVSRRNLIELSEKIPGPNGLPLLGNALEFIGSSPGKEFIYHPLILVQLNNYLMSINRVTLPWKLWLKKAFLGILIYKTWNDMNNQMVWEWKYDTAFYVRKIPTRK